MAITRTPSSKTTTKKTAASATAKPPAGKTKTAPRTRSQSAAAPIQAASAATDAKPVKPRTPRKATAKKEITPEQRYQMIAQAAYFRAERHGFSSGRALEDWIAAEQEIDSMLKSAKK